MDVSWLVIGCFFTETRKRKRERWARCTRHWTRVLLLYETLNDTKPFPSWSCPNHEPIHFLPSHYSSSCRWLVLDSLCVYSMPLWNLLDFDDCHHRHLRNQINCVHQRYDDHFGFEKFARQTHFSVETNRCDLFLNPHIYLHRQYDRHPPHHQKCLEEDQSKLKEHHFDKINPTYSRISLQWTKSLKNSYPLVLSHRCSHAKNTFQVLILQISDELDDIRFFFDWYFLEIELSSRKLEHIV